LLTHQAREDVFDLHVITWMQELKQTPPDPIHLKDTRLGFNEDASEVIPSSWNSF